MRTSRVKAKWARGEAVLCTTLHLTDPSLYELTSLLGFDGIWMDLEHHGQSVETAAQFMRAARVGVSDIIARPAKGEMMRMGRMLEMGAQGIMYPRCNDADEAAEVVRWAKFAPLGQRGFDGSNADSLYCSVPLAEYVERANQETFIIIQLEEPAAVQHAAAIAAIDGVDALMLGPADFSILAGFPGQFDQPQLEEAIRQIAAAAHASGKAWGKPVSSFDEAKKLLDMGAKLFFHGADILMVRNGLTAIQQEFAKLGFSFESRIRPEG